MRRRRVLVAAVLILFGIAALVLVFRSAPAPGHLPYAEWRMFKDRFITKDGRVVDTGNGNITHSEGQGYGMLFAEAAGDRRTFDLLWDWTREHLQTRPDDRLLSWLWKETPEGGAVADPNNASDGEILVAWALVRASERWGSFAYQRAAAELLIELRRLCVVPTPQGPALLPGLFGFREEERTVLNGSYYVFPAFHHFERVFPGLGWDEVARAGERLLAATKFGRWELNPDWIALSEGVYSLETKFPPDFGYNAIRIPLHVAWGNPSSDLLKSYANFWRGLPDLSKMPATVNLETNAFGPHAALPGMQAIAQFTLACAQGESISVPPITHDEPYYSASLKFLTRLAIHDIREGQRK